MPEKKIKSAANIIKTGATKPAPAKKAEPKSTVFSRVHDLMKEVRELNDRGLGSFNLGIVPTGIQFTNIWSDVLKKYKSKIYKTLEDVEADLVPIRDLVKRSAPVVIQNITGDGQTAKVTKRGIEVGCRLVTFPKFDALVAGVARFRENAKLDAKAKPKAKAKPIPKKVPAKRT